MNTKLLLIEGIPGSGKSTLARKAAEFYRDRGVTVNLFIEGDAHPADLGWHACIPKGRYDEVLRRYDALRGDIERYTRFEGAYAIVAYTQVKDAPQTFRDEMEGYEVYDGRVPDELFFGLHYGRWRTFGAYAAGRDELNIFESAFLQNHVNELLFWRNADARAAAQHHNRLLEAVSGLSPVLIYLSQPDIRETIRRVANERLSPDGHWIDRCIAYCERSPFGQRHGVKGFEGAMRFFEARKQVEMKILERLSIPYAVIENPDYDWDAVWARIMTYLVTVQ